MLIDSKLLPPRAPFLNPYGLPADEEGPARAFVDNLRDLEGCSRDFTHALALYDVATAEREALRAACRDRRQQGEMVWPPENSAWTGFPTIVIRFGGVTIRNFGQALSAARGVIGRIPSWIDRIDRAALKDVEGRFREAFPNIDKVRHSISHPEFYADPTKKMGVDGDFDVGNIIQVRQSADVTIRGIYADRTFASTFDGLVVSYELNADNALLLVELATASFAAVAELDPLRR